MQTKPLDLLPPPHRILMKSGCNLGMPPKRVICNLSRKEDDAYRLSITPEAVVISASTESGLFYGEQTLLQIKRQSNGALPCLEIFDWPDYPVRGFYHDITRGKVPTLETLLALADKCAHYKINQLQLYIEHTYAFKNHPEVWKGADPLTAEEIRTLDAHCARLHIDLVPSFSTFGHLYGVIHTKKFQHLNELERDVADEPITWWDRQMHYTLDCRNPESIALIREIIAEVRPLFRSNFFNICADETFDLGKGKNQLEAEKRGVGRLYIDFLKQIMAAVQEAGAIPMFWGDVIAHHQEVIAEIPTEAIALDWDYGAKLEQTIAGVMQEKNRTFYVCPGVCGWTKWMPDYQTAHQNITRFAKFGLEKGAVGLLNTDWGDFGHMNALGLSFPGLIVGAAASWNTRSGALANGKMEGAISRYEMGDKTGKILSLMREAVSASRGGWYLIALWQQPRSLNIPANWFDEKTGYPDVLFKHSYQKHQKALEKILSCTVKIEKLLLTLAPQDELLRDEIRTGLLGLRMLEEVHLLLQNRVKPGRKAPPKAKAVAERIRKLEESLSRDWLKRNKPSDYSALRDVLLGVAKSLSL